MLALLFRSFNTGTEYSDESALDAIADIGKNTNPSLKLKPLNLTA
jgi:hypothetical protein